MFLQGGAPPPLLGIENYYNSPSVNGPSGFKSKHLNFFFRICLYAVYWVIISIFRKYHLGNFPQIHFKDITEMKCIYRSKIKRKISFQDIWIFFLQYFLKCWWQGPKICNISWTVQRHFVVRNQSPKSTALLTRYCLKKSFWCDDFEGFHFKNPFIGSI